MAHTTFTNDAIDLAAEHLYDAIHGLYNAPITQGLDLAAVNTAADELRALLPAEAEHAKQFAYDEFANESDYEMLYEGLSLVAMYALIDVLHLNDMTKFGDFTRTFQAATDDVSALASYTGTWDWEYGVFRHDGDDKA